MTITLSAETQVLLEDRMRLSGFKTADEAVRTMLQETHKPMDEDDRSPETLAAIQRGIADADAGRTRPWEEVKKELLERYRDK